MINNIKELPSSYRLISKHKLYKPEGNGTIFKMTKGKNLQPRILYLARFSFRFDGEIKSFHKQKFREFNTINPALQQMLKEFPRQEIQEKEKTYRKETQNN